VILQNITPNGRNINLDCGALHPAYVAAEVRVRGADLGLTFDGDADRCMLAGSRNNVLNGDAILLMAARDLKARGLLTGDLVVATTMSNMGLEAALRRSGIHMLRAPVGDRYVLEEMLKRNRAKYKSHRLVRLAGDATNLPLPDESIDVILCFNTAPHLGPGEAAFRDLFRVLAPGGVIAVGHLMNSTELNRFHGNLHGPIAQDHLPPASLDWKSLVRGRLADYLAATAGTP